MAADAGLCPRCDAPREAGQRYCLDCGLRLPVARGAVPALRRAWLKGLGWYPGDWVWPATLALVIAAAGAAGAVLLANRGSGGGTTFAATNAAAATPAATTVATTVGRGSAGWPSGRRGWTVVLVSLPRAGGAEKAQVRAAKAAKTGLPDAGYLVSDRYASLHPGYYIVFAGIYGNRAEAEAAVPTARAKGFGGAYARPVAD